MVATDDLDHEATGSRGDAARILLDLYKENLGFVRHYEEIRFKFSQLTITLAAALVEPIEGHEPWQTPRNPDSSVHRVVRAFRSDAGTHIY